MPKPKTKHPRLVRKGEVVKIKGTELTEVVRDVTVVLHLANGQDVVYGTNELVDLGELPDEPSDEEIQSVVDADVAGDGVIKLAKTPTRRGSR